MRPVIFRNIRVRILRTMFSSDICFTDRKDELRLKSHSDLHKLWFVLLKERNMLLTMEQAYKEEYVNLPNEERIDKVELSMENLEEVVRERNRAYHQLEVGSSGERERSYRPDCFGRMVPYKPREHSLPYWANTGYRRRLRFRFMNSGREDVLDFGARLRERMVWTEKKNENHQMQHVSAPYLVWVDANLYFIHLYTTLYLCSTLVWYFHE